MGQGLRTRLSGASELMDLGGSDRRELEEALRNLAWINRRLGGLRLVLRELPRLIAVASRPIRILDVATGYADVPRAVVTWLRRRGIAVSVKCLDRHREVLRIAARASLPFPEIRCLAGDATSLPFSDGSFDLVVASLVLHHMEGDGPVRLLREVWRVSRRSVLVNDLRRGLPAYLVTWAFLHAAFRNRLILFDGPLSVRRSYTPSEAADLIGRAGWGRARILRHAFFRMALIGEKG
jgi:SAM-dependent methyltransferase